MLDRVTHSARRRRSWCLATVLVLAGLAAPAAAMANGAVTLQSGQLDFAAARNEVEDLSVVRQVAAFQCAPRVAPCIQFANGKDIDDLVPGDACVKVTDLVVACDPKVAGSIHVDLDDGDDRAFVGDSVPPTTVEGGAGEDTLISSNGGDALHGDAGNDDVEDTSDTGGGDDLLDGGPGNDAIQLAKGDDKVLGGTGSDSLELTSGDDTVRLNGVADDGVSGETKNIASDIETIDGRGGGDSLVGDGGANTLRGGAGNDVVDGGGGADTLEGGAGADTLVGGAGTDRVVYPEAAAQHISLDDLGNDGAAGELDNVRADIENVAAGPGADVVAGSAAANVLDGGAGDDRIDGRGGVDTYVGGAGADTLLARDRGRDVLLGGPGRDSARVDRRLDRLSSVERILH
jgi:Ca2+-binding RTX toxin-like protein